MNRSASDIFRLEHEIITKCGISKERFRKVSGNQWENIYQKIQKNINGLSASITTILFRVLERD